METVKTIDEVRQRVKAWKREGLSVGFVPTMGYLHDGHRSLILKAAEQNDRVVVSIFVNPIQFGVNEDFDKYPRDIKHDEKICTAAGAHLIFNPEVSEMYSNDRCTYVNVEKLTEGLCGARRPGHFQGVCTVVSKLFNIVTPDRAYFGEKDAQQLAVIRKMTKDLNFDIEIIGCPIVREKDGLAMSSRNAYLNEEERKAALVLYNGLMNAKRIMEMGEIDSNNIRKAIIEKIHSEPLARIDYIEIVDSESLKPVDTVKDKVLVAIAVYIGSTRLIDNFTFDPENRY